MFDDNNTMVGGMGIHTYEALSLYMKVVYSLKVWMVIS